MWREPINADPSGGSVDDLPQDLRRHAVSPEFAGFVDRPEEAAFCDLSCFGPGIHDFLYPERNRNGANVTTLANQIGNYLMLFA